MDLFYLQTRYQLAVLEAYSVYMDQESTMIWEVGNHYYLEFPTRILINNRLDQ